MLGDMPLPAKFFIAFVLVLALIGGVAWLVRRFGAGALGASTARGRQARLGVIEAAAVDGRRRLVLVRRDNVEHLIMLGGPTDLVVEANIVRAQAAAMREAAAQPGWPPPAESAAWPGPPEPAFRAARGPERQPAPPAVAEDLPLQPHPEPAPRMPTGDRLAGLAAELARAGTRVEPPVGRPAAESPRRPAEPRRPAAPARALEPPRVKEEAHAGDQHLAAMAQQLEAALRRSGQAGPPREAPAGEPAGAPPSRRPAEPREPRTSLMERAMHARSSASLAPARAGAGEPPPVPAEPRESAGADMTMPPEPVQPPPLQSAAPAEPAEPNGGPAETPEAAATRAPSLEEEMANLLGRTPGKT
jgi:hypothetical protein